MFNGLAIESKCQYCSLRSHVIGLCHEHSKNVDTKVTNCKSIEKIQTALFQELDPDKRVCFVSDAIILAIAPYARTDHYTPIPIVLMPSDKTKTGDKLAAWIRK